MGVSTKEFAFLFVCRKLSDFWEAAESKQFDNIGVLSKWSIYSTDSWLKKHLRKVVFPVSRGPNIKKLLVFKGDTILWIILHNILAKTECTPLIYYSGVISAIVLILML
jgi:hypothetical protein